MPVVAVLHQFDRSKLGHVGPPLRAAGVQLDERRIDAGDPLPDLDAVDGLVVLGGDQSAVQAEADPLLVRETALLRDAVAAGLPTLGICLGGQLLAHALGGGVRHVGRRVEWRDLQRLPATGGDPLFGELSEPVPALHWNEDVFEAPLGAEVLLGPASDGVEAFRAPGRAPAWGVQYHPDVDAEVLDEWLQEWGEQVSAPAAFGAASSQRLAAQAQASKALFGGFARIVLGR